MPARASRHLVEDQAERAAVELMRVAVQAGAEGEEEGEEAQGVVGGGGRGGRVVRVPGGDCAVGVQRRVDHAVAGGGVGDAVRGEEARGAQVGGGGRGEELGALG